jgi:hypothetical protein
MILTWLLWIVAIWADSVALSLASWLLYMIGWAWFHRRSYLTAAAGVQAFRESWVQRVLFRWMAIELLPVFVLFLCWRRYRVRITTADGKERR